MAGKAAAISLGICVLFALGGAKFLDLMGISLSSFRIAGGTLAIPDLARHGVRPSIGHPDPPRPSGRNRKKREDISVFPLAFPFIAGRAPWRPSY